MQNGLKIVCVCMYNNMCQASKPIENSHVSCYNNMSLSTLKVVAHSVFSLHLANVVISLNERKSMNAYNI